MRPDRRIAVSTALFSKEGNAGCCSVQGMLYWMLKAD